MFLKRECWILISLFFLKKGQVNALSRENELSGEAGPSNAKEIDKFIIDSSASSSRNWFDFCGNIFKKDHQLAIMGLQFQRDGRYEDAIYCFTKALGKNPKDPVPYFRLRGDCYREMGKEIDALRDYREVVTRNNDNNKTDRIILGRLLYAAGRFEEAVREMILTKNAAEIASLGLDLFRKQQYEAALDCFNVSIELNSNVAEYYRKRACCLAKMPYEAALRIKDLKKALELDSNLSDRLLLIRALFDAKEYKDAIKEALDLNDFEGLVRFGDVLVSRKDYNDALLFYDAVIEENPREAQYYKHRGTCYALMQMYNKAISDFYEMMLAEPDNRRHSAHLRDILRDYGKIDESVEKSLTVLTVSDLENLGNQFCASGKFGAAIRCFNKALVRATFRLDRSPSGSVYRSRGKCYLKMQDLTKAISDICDMFRMDPNNKQYKADLKIALRDYGKIDEFVAEIVALLSSRDLEDLGNQFFNDGKLSTALQYFDEVLNRGPTKSGYTLRGKCFLEMENFGAAISDLRMALEMVGNTVGRSEDCMKLLRRALANYDAFNDVPDDTLNLLNDTELQILGNHFKLGNKFDEALRCYSAAVRKDSNNPASIKLRANLHLRMNNTNEAVEDFLEVVKIDPDDRSSWTTVRRLLTAAERFNELIQYSITLVHDIPELMDLCDEFYFTHKYEEALRCYTEAINKYPTNLDIRQRRGNVFWGTDKLELAIDDFLYVARKDPKNKENWTSLRQLLFQSERFAELIDYTIHLSKTKELASLGDRFSYYGHVDEAIRCYTEAINKNDRDPQYYKRRAEVYLRANNVDDAILDRLQVMDLNRYDVDNWSALSSLLYEHERFDQLIECTFNLNGLDELEELCKKLRLEGKLDVAVRCYTYPDRDSLLDPEFYKRRVTFYLELDKVDDAVSDLLTVSKINPEDSENWIRLIQTLLDAGRMEELFEYIENAISDLNASQLAGMADKFVSREEFDKAVHCYTQAILKDQFDPKFYKRRGNGYVKMKHLDKAEFDFVQAVELDPGDTESLASLNKILFESERYDELINYTIPLTKMDELAKLGDKFMAADLFEKALRCYNEGIMKYQVEPVYYNKRGLCHWKMRNSENAISDLRKAIELEPYNVDYRVDLLNVLTEVRRLNEAKTAFAGALQVQKTSRDGALLEESRQKIEIMSYTVFTDYLKELINRDARLQIDRIRDNSESFGFDTVSYNKIKDLEFDRDSCLEELTRAEFENRTRILETPKDKSIGSPDPPDYFVDKVFFYESLRDPVITPKGITYEREVILKNIQNFHRDPVSCVELEEKDLRPNLAVKEGAELWRANY